VNLSGRVRSDGDLVAWLDAGGLAGVRELVLWNGRITDAGAQALAICRDASGLEALDLLGRSKSDRVDFVLPGRNVGRVHCRVRVAGAGGVLVSDMGSANGTFLNGRQIRGEVPFVTGDELFVGDFVITLARPPERI
jgi:hypothetical protein